MDKDNNSSGWKIHEEQVKSPTVNYINITRRPEGGIVNVEMKRHPGPQMNTGDNIRTTRVYPTPRGSSLPSSLNDLTDPMSLFDSSSRLKSLLRQHQQKLSPTGFSISSSNDTSGGLDSEGTRLVINPPPLPVHVVERHGSSSSPYHVVIHPRSQSSENVINSSPEPSTFRNISSPRSSSTGHISSLETKFPLLRAVSPFGQRSFLISSPLFAEGGARLSLFDRFNEHAPPSFFDSRLRSASNPENFHVSRMTVVRDGGQKPQVHNIPIKIEGRDTKSERPSKPSVVYKIPINLISKNTDSRSSQQPPPSVKSRGISIPIITHKTTSSEAEEKLAALTKQLEDEMRSTGPPRSVPPKTIVTAQTQSIKPAAVLPKQEAEPVPEEAKVSVTLKEITVSPSEDVSVLIKESKSLLPDAAEAVVEKKSEPVVPLPDAGRSAVDKRVEELAQELQNQLEETQEDLLLGACFKCNSELKSDACRAMGNLYHSSCFQCSICGKTLKGKSFFNVQGTFYCEEDFTKAGYRRVAESCHACGNHIVDQVLQALGNSYHPSCFRCSHCSKNLENETFTVDSNDRVYCVEDYFQIHSSKCFVCGKTIMPPKGDEELERVSVMGKTFHIECFKCQKCGLTIGIQTGERCYPAGDDFLCKACHLTEKQA